MTPEQFIEYLKKILTKQNIDKVVRLSVLIWPFVRATISSMVVEEEPKKETKSKDDAKTLLASVEELERTYAG